MSPVLGVIEGFYGRPWPPEDRLDLITFCGERGMNGYVYAPKDDPRHRARWREPYPAHEMDHFRAVDARCRSLGMSFGFTVSPGLDIDFGSAADRLTLLAKLRAMVDLGAGWLVLAFDDLPGRGSQAAGQGELTAWLHERLGGGSGVRLSVVPSEYAGVTASRYLAELSSALPDDVDIAWTGRFTVSPTVGVPDVGARAAATGGRRPLLWDNYPVNDFLPLSLFLGPYQGRDPQLLDMCSGILCNPMPQAHASKVALATAAAFFRQGARYRPEEAWAEAIADVGGRSAPALRTLAAACADSALTPPSALAIHRLLDRYEAGAATGDELAALLLEARDAAAAVAGQLAPLWAEVRPWLSQLHLEARAGLNAVRLLGAIAGGVTAEVAEAALQLQGAWVRARAATPETVFGPRFANYPITSYDADGVEVPDLGSAIVEDASAIDRLCRLALRAYARWSTEPEEAVGL